MINIIHKIYSIRDIPIELLEDQTLFITIGLKYNRNPAINNALYTLFTCFSGTFNYEKNFAKVSSSILPPSIKGPGPHRTKALAHGG